MKRIVIVVGHSRPNTFCEALAESYAKGAQAAGHEVKLFVTCKMAFDPILHEGFNEIQPLEADLKAAHDAMLAADHLVLIFPLWLGTLPAILKGFLERVLQPDLVGPSRQGKFVRLLEGKSARVIITMGMPGFIYRWWYGAHALKMLKRNILRFMGVSPIRSTIYGNVEGAGPERRARWLRDVEAMGRGNL
ncbi:MAG TPA: NAD(P)H-dependent oxidoreductase [Xanthobacteraceae bacterium]|nr:NAD(P)H-dependent oxidoreductase [Xanthobacteraceae bacterium]